MELDTLVIVITIISFIAIIIQFTIGVKNIEHNTNLVGLNREKNEKKVVFLDFFMCVISVMCVAQFSNVWAFILGCVYGIVYYIQITVK